MRALRRRRWIVGVGAALVVVVLVLVGGHTGQHVVRSLLLPGAGLYGEHLAVGLTLTGAAVVATIAWLRWGVDWSLVAVYAVAVVLTVTLGDTHADGDALAAQRAAHEFPLVVLVLAAIGWLRSTARRVPFLSRLRVHRRELRGLTDLDRLGAVDRCRAAAIAALSPSPGTRSAGGKADERSDTASVPASEIIAAVESEKVVARARSVGLVARGRLGGDPFRIDHAHARAALALWGRLDGDARARLRADAERSWTGVPASEPGWVRLLDGTLVALALRDESPRVAQRWTEMLNGPMRLGRSHRPAWVWTPLGVAAGRPDDWEHAAATALARAGGWIGDDDWAVLRRRALGAAARGAEHPADERLIAAGRVWAGLVGDEAAARLLARPTVRRDPLAVALDTYARSLHP